VVWARRGSTYRPRPASAPASVARPGRADARGMARDSSPAFPRTPRSRRSPAPHEVLHCSVRSAARGPRRPESAPSATAPAPGIAGTALAFVGDVVGVAIHAGIRRGPSRPTPRCRCSRGRRRSVVHVLLVVEGGGEGRVRARASDTIPE
jgi:hypothetical protein